MKPKSNMTWISSILLCVLILFTSISIIQQVQARRGIYYIEVKVYDSKTGEPIRGAKVKIMVFQPVSRGTSSEWSSNKKYGYFRTICYGETNWRGWCYFSCYNAYPEQPCIIKVSKFGYITWSDSIVKSGYCYRLVYLRPYL